MSRWWDNPGEDYEAPLSDRSPHLIRRDRDMSRGNTAFMSKDDVAMAAALRGRQASVYPSVTKPYRPLK